MKFSFFAVLFFAGLSLAQDNMTTDELDSKIESSTELDESGSAPVETVTPKASYENAGEWANFDYQELGLTQWEFQTVKEKGISKAKLLQLLEIGVRPSEYFEEPWKKLNVSEGKWLAERASGMEDSDIDRSYRNKGVRNGDAWTSLALPSYYQWKHHNIPLAVTMDVIWVASVASYTWLSLNSKVNDKVFLLAVTAGVHMWSFMDGFSESQWDSNPDAARFSWGIIPTNQGILGAVRLGF